MEGYAKKRHWMVKKSKKLQTSLPVPILAIAK